MGKIKKTETELQREKTLRELVAKSEIHYKVINHRATCKKFQKDYYCAECIGGSLIEYASTLLEELKYLDKCKLVAKAYS